MKVYKTIICEYYFPEYDYKSFEVVGTSDSKIDAERGKYNGWLIRGIHDNGVVHGVSIDDHFDDTFPSREYVIENCIAFES